MGISEVTRVATKQGRRLLNLKLKRCGAVIVAAGSAQRMGGVDKIMADLGGEPLILRTTRAFLECEAISEIVIVTRPDLVMTIRNLMAGFDKVTAVVAGGKDRAESVSLGLSAFSGKIKLAAIHDGARPLVSMELIDRVVRAANSYGAAAPAIELKDTVKVVTGGIVSSTPDRSTLRAVQTPQVFQFDLLRAALKKAKEEGAAITDDCSAVERMGMSVKIVKGEERNLKVTTPVDLCIVRMLLEEV